MWYKLGTKSFEHFVRITDNYKPILINPLNVTSSTYFCIVLKEVCGSWIISFIKNYKVLKSKRYLLSIGKIDFLNFFGTQSVSQIQTNKAR